MPVPGADVDFDDVAGLQSTVDKWTSNYAATSDMHDAAAFGAIPADKQVSARGIEVGHIFYFGTKYSEPMKAVVSGPDGVEKPVHMGSYGIGPSRLVAAIIEASHDDAGIKWPEPVAPFKVGDPQPQAGRQRDRCGMREALSRLPPRASTCCMTTSTSGPGAKFATADLIGVPWQVVIGPKGLAAGTVRGQEAGRRQPGEFEPGRNRSTCLSR